MSCFLYYINIVEDILIHNALVGALSGQHTYWPQHEDSVPRGSGSVDKAPDKWTNVSSNLESRIFLILHYKWRLRDTVLLLDYSIALLMIFVS